MKENLTEGEFIVDFYKALYKAVFNTAFTDLLLFGQSTWELSMSNDLITLQSSMPMSGTNSLPPAADSINVKAINDALSQYRITPSFFGFNSIINGDMIKSGIDLLNYPLEDYSMSGLECNCSMCRNNRQRGQSFVDKNKAYTTASKFNDYEYVQESFRKMQESMLGAETRAAISGSLTNMSSFSIEEDEDEDEYVDDEIEELAMAEDKGYEDALGDIKMDLSMLFAQDKSNPNKVNINWGAVENNVESAKLNDEDLVSDLVNMIASALLAARKVGFTEGQIQD